jgi:hypothetical protein
MRQPQRSQPSRSARLAPGAFSSTTLPEVLEHSTLRLPDIQRSIEGIPGRGILVKLFPVSPKNMRSVSGSKRTLWIVGSPDASSAFPSNREGAQKFGAKTTQPTKAGSLHGQSAKANATNGKAEGRRPLVRGERKPLMSDGRGKGNVIETDDSSEEEDEDAENDKDEEVEEGGDGEEEEEEEGEEGEAEKGEAEKGEAEKGEAGEGEAEEEEGEEEEGEGDEENGTENFNTAKDVTTKRNAVEDVENENDAEEQDDDRNDGELDEAQAKEADKRKDRDDSGEEDKEKDAQDEEEREKEAEGEHEAEEAGDNIEKPRKTGGKGGADEDEQAEENEDEDNEMADEESGNHDKVREDREAMKQRVTANNRDGARRGCRLGDMTDKEREERDIGSDGEERMAGENDGDPEERRKRPLKFDCPTPGDRPNKRSKGDDSESEDTAATGDLPKLTFNLGTTPRPRTSSPTSTTASPGSILEIVRQTSVVPGLENTEKAVWDAAQRDSNINSLPREQQTKMIHSALSLVSEEGIKALKHFVYNAHRNGKRKVKTLESDFDLSAPHSGVDIWHTTGALVPRNSGLAHFSALYQQIDFIDNKATLFSITKRVKLAAMAQYRKGLLQEGAGKNQARDVNLYLFRAIYPEHATIERPDDKATKFAAHNDWIRLRDRLREGRLWLDVRDRFGGVGAFLALPPQCVPDRHVVKMPAKTFKSWLRLLDVAWRALDAHARLTLNDLVRMSLAGQSLPEGSLMLEMLEDGTDTAPISLSGMLTGWPAFDRNSAEDEGGLTATLTQHEEDGDTAIPGTHLITANTTSRAEEARDGRLISQEGMMGNLEDGLFNGLDDRDFDECLN